MAGRPIDPKYLRGLKFKSSVGKKVTDDGREVMKYSSVERPMLPGDVLDWKDRGDNIVLVTADGQKLTVSKEKENKE